MIITMEVLIYNSTFMSISKIEAFLILYQIYRTGIKGTWCVWEMPRIGFLTTSTVLPYHYLSFFIISLRLLALILCSNCSKLFNKSLTYIVRHLLNYFLQLGLSLGLAQHFPRMVLAFHAPPWLVHPFPQAPPPNFLLPPKPSIYTLLVPPLSIQVALFLTCILFDLLLFHIKTNSSYIVPFFGILFLTFDNISHWSHCRVSAELV